MIYLMVVHCEGILMEVIYANIKPYVEVERNKSNFGIFPEVFEFADLFCYDSTTNYYKYNRTLSFKKEVSSITHLKELLDSNSNYTESATPLENITSEKALWFPILEVIDVHSYKHIKRRNLTMFSLQYFEKVAVIASEKRIHLLEKVYIGLSHCTSAALLAVAGCIIFALLIWARERFHSDYFKGKRFVKGFGTAVWLSVVTIGTVGYGDITPKTLIGRLVALVFMAFGIVFSSVMTATISENVFSNSFELHGQSVTAIYKSPEHNLALNDYRANYVKACTVEEIIENLRHGKATFALLNADIASYYQEKFQSSDASDDQYVFISSLDVKMPVQFLVNTNNPAVKMYMDCLQKHWDKILPIILSKYKKHLQYQTLYHIPTRMLFVKYPILFYVTCGLAFFIFVGITYDVYGVISLERKKTVRGKYPFE